MPKPVPPPYAIASVDRALRIIPMLGEAPVRVSDVATRLGVAPSTAHRLLAMLVFHGFAVQDEARSYRAGPALHRDASDARRHDLRAVARPHLERLGRLHDETVHLMVRQGSSMRFLDSVEGSQALRVGSRVGALMPAHLCSGGRALLAELGQEALATVYLEDPVPDVPDAARMRRSLIPTRRRGYALNLGDTERGIHAIGVVVHGADGHPIGAISLSMPSLRLPRRRIPELAETVRTAAAGLDADLRA